MIVELLSFILKHLIIYNRKKKTIDYAIRLEIRNTPLHLAIESSRDEIVQSLVEFIINKKFFEVFNSENDQHCPRFHWASRHAVKHSCQCRTDL
jgi:ankyrin repeat protein